MLATYLFPNGMLARRHVNGLKGSIGGAYLIEAGGSQTLPNHIIAHAVYENGVWKVPGLPKSRNDFLRAARIFKARTQGFIQ